MKKTRLLTENFQYVRKFSIPGKCKKSLNAIKQIIKDKLFDKYKSGVEKVINIIIDATRSLMLLLIPQVTGSLYWLSVV